jgi:hypothetical protein
LITSQIPGRASHDVATLQAVNTDADILKAKDVTDLREAQRIIAELRHALERHAELTYFADGEFTIFLDDEHTNMVTTLFEQQRLVKGQGQASELHDTLSDFVSHWLDFQWNIGQIDQEKSG